VETQDWGTATPAGVRGVLLSRGNRLSAAYLVVSILAIAIYFAASRLSIFQAVVALACNMLVVLAIAAGMVLRRPAPSDVWWLLGASQVLGLIAFVVSYVYPLATGGDVPVISIGNGLYLLARVLDVLALLRLVRRRGPALQRGGWLDILMVTTGVGSLSLTFVILPIAEGPGSLLERAFVLAFPVLGLMLLALLVCVMLTFDYRQPADALLIGFVFSQLVWDNAYSVNAFQALAFHGRGWFGFQLLALALLGAAALHPSMRDVCRDRAPKGRGAPTAKRLLFLILIALIPTMVMVYQDTLIDPQIDTLILDAAAGTVFVLAMLRAAELGVSLSEHERVLAELEDEVEFRRRVEQELKRSNVELEQFAYVASHDLQEPLRMVAGYVQLLARRYRGRLDEEADEFIHYAVEGAVRMQALINDLLTYSRVGTKGKPLVATGLDAALDDALTNLSLTISETGAEVIRGPLPRVIGDPGQLVQLFQNLVGNALKFRSNARAEVRISAAPAGEMVQVSVADNGIGIEPQSAKRIFDIFQRLHTRDEYTGTGIGLAVCKKIVERHGGDIWVESQPGQGAAFHFTLRSAEATPRPGVRRQRESKPELREVSA
jgi:signal transduction histidine kinase